MAPLTTFSLESLNIITFHLNEKRQNEPLSNNSKNGSLSAGAKAGIAFGVIIPVVLISLGLFYLYTHNWTVPERWRPKLKLKVPHWQRPKLPSPPTWRARPWQRVASVTQKSSPPPSQSDLSQTPNADVEISERPVPGKWWSAEEIGKAGEKNNTGRSRFSVNAPPEPREPKIVKAPKPPSIFTSKTSIYGVEREKGEPEVVRPSSRHVKTWSRHISTQFMDFGRPATKRESVVEESGEGRLERPVSVRVNKRDSKSVITNLDWMQYEPPR